MSLIYSNAGFDEPAEALLIAELGAHTLQRGAATQSILHVGSGDELGEAEIVFGQPDPHALLDAPKLRWVQLTTAGWTRYDSDELPAATLEQAGARGWPQAALRRRSRVLRGELVLLLGYGAIARAMVARLGGFGLRLVGYRRRARGDEEIEVVGPADLDHVLAEADHVFDLLPESAETRGFVDAHRLARMKPGARVYNLGRGATVDQDALAAALERGHLDAAWLDVTSPEPLPPEHPLWSAPNLHISPHIAGGQQQEDSALVRQFLANLRAYEAGRPLVDRVV